MSAVPKCLRHVTLFTAAMSGMLYGQLSIVSGGRDIVLNSESMPHQTLVVEWSDNLTVWQPFAQVAGVLAPYGMTRRGNSWAFFRMQARPIETVDDWTNQLSFDTDLTSSPFTKFTLPLNDPFDLVYFQDGVAYPFHYHFIVSRLRGYEQLTLAEFESVALRRDGQLLLLGSVVFAPDRSVKEVAIQFAGQDVYPVEMVADWFEVVRGRLAFTEGWRFFYMPTFEQRQATFENEAFFESRDIRVDSPARWATSHVCYSSGWAFGRLVFVTADEIDAAYGDGRLTNEDILITDGVPAEIPVVAGIISLTPATPNSHVAILAKSFGIPFAFASGEGFQEQLKALTERELLLVVREDDHGACVITATDTTEKLTAEERQAILDLKKPAAPMIRPKQSAKTFNLKVDELTPDDIDVVGGKAANFGFLRRAIPDHSPSPVIALTFDLWDAFLDQSFEDVSTLRQRIAQRLEGVTYPPDLGFLRPALADVRNWIQNQATFNTAQRERIVEVLGVFEPSQKIRFRSSTNVEDSEAFSGAGLYDSFSGCLVDDTDGDDVGPSGCDVFNSSERGVFRAIRKVYASFYNENAYVERLRHGIREEDVGMAVLVHHSFPDEDELANGVATMDIRRTDGGRMVSIDLVSQLGAESVTNPDSAKQPEWAHATYGDVANPDLTLRQPSALVEDGAKVMIWPEDYQDLVELLDRAARTYESVFSDGELVLLDFEFKKMKPGLLVVKQIRAIPQPPIIPPPVLAEQLIP